MSPAAGAAADRVYNLTLACRPCNHAKDNRSVAELDQLKVQVRAKQALRDATAVNTRKHVPGRSW